MKVNLSILILMRGMSYTSCNKIGLRSIESPYPTLSFSRLTSSDILSCTAAIDCDDKNSCTDDFCDKFTNTCKFNETTTFSSECRTFGSPSALAIRVIALDSETTSSSFEISNFIFGTLGEELNLRSQISACSHGKLDIVPYDGFTETGERITNGVGTVTINKFAFEESASAIVEEIISEGTILFGDFESQFDFVLLCLPPGTKLGTSTNWQGYGSIDSYLSVYNDLNCNYPSVLMHEFGHNLGLSHSNDELNYGDASGTMGISYSSTDSPSRCYNGPKSWQLGWYYDSHFVIDKAIFVQGIYSLVGVADYLNRQNSLTIIKIINNKDAYDYYITFNSDKNEINEGTLEGANEILITKRPSGFDYSDSILLESLVELQAFNIIAPGDTEAVEILPVKIDNKADPPVATLSIRCFKYECTNDELCNDFNDCTVDTCSLNPLTGKSECQHIDLDCASCGAMASVHLTTNDYPEHLFWKIEYLYDDVVMLSSGYYEYSSSSSSTNKCLGFGKYKFKLFNTKDNSQSDFNYAFVVGNSIIDSDQTSDAILVEKEFTICSSDTECEDFNGCTIDFCDVGLNLCKYTELSDMECSDCDWFSLTLNTDNYPEEIIWDITTFDYYGNKENVISSGDPFPDSDYRLGRSKAPTKFRQGRISNRFSSQERRRLFSETISYRVCLQQNVTYSFKMEDTFGDGICCSVGLGNFAMSLAGQEVLSGGDFGESTSLSFSLWECSSDRECDDFNSCTQDICYIAISICIHKALECSECGKEVKFEITTNAAPLGTSWSIDSNDSGHSVLSGGPYASSCTPYLETKCLPYGSYTFNFYSSIGAFSQQRGGKKGGGKKGEGNERETSEGKRSRRRSLSSPTSSSCSKKSDYSLSVGKKSILKDKGFYLEPAINVTFLIEMP